mgnify:CR=1 FL=1
MGVDEKIYEEKNIEEELISQLHLFEKKKQLELFKVENLKKPKQIQQPYIRLYQKKINCKNFEKEGKKAFYQISLFETLEKQYELFKKIEDNLKTN